MFLPSFLNISVYNFLAQRNVCSRLHLYRRFYSSWIQINHALTSVGTLVLTPFTLLHLSAPSSSSSSSSSPASSSLTPCSPHSRRLFLHCGHQRASVVVRVLPLRSIDAQSSSTSGGRHLPFPTLVVSMNVRHIPASCRRSCLRPFHAFS